MTDLTITDIGDAWVDSTRTGLNTGSAAWVQVKSGERRGFLLPPLPPLAGRTILSATLVGRVGPGHVGQTYTVEPCSDRWSPGTVTWTGQPVAVTAAGVTETVSALPDGGLVEIDVLTIIASVAAGTKWLGLRITTDSSADGQKFYATDSGEPAWELLITFSDVPEQPSNLRPDGGAVANQTPWLAWDFVDFGGDSADQAEFRVQVDTPFADPDEVSPDYDSGWIGPDDGGSEPQFKLGVSTYTTVGAGPHYWRVKVKDAAGLESDWSDWASFYVSGMPTLVIDSPVGPFGDPSPTLLAHLSSGTVVAWKAWATGPDRSDIRARSGAQTGAIAWEIPHRNKDGRRVFREDEACWIKLQVWDDVDRAVAVGQSPAIEQWIPVTFDSDLGVEAPTNLSVSAAFEPGDPRHRWMWRRTEAADGWLAQVDGVTVARIDADDVTYGAGTGTYQWIDSGVVPPLRPSVLSIRAIEGTDRSEPANRTVQGHVVEGVWLIPEAGDPIVLEGTAVGGFARGDRVATYQPLVGPEVDIIYDYTGLSDTFDGTVDNRDGDVWAKVAAIKALGESRTRVVRMVWGSESISARIADPSVVPHDDMTPTNLLHAVRFRFVQVGD